MGHSIGLSPDRKKMTFGIFKFNPDCSESSGFEEKTTIELSKKEAKTLIKSLKDWERVMEE